MFTDSQLRKKENEKEEKESNQTTKVIGMWAMFAFDEAGKIQSGL